MRCPNRNRGEAVLLADPRNCSRFYICSNGVPIRQSCPAGLRFNSRLRVCDWPRNVHCRGGRSFAEQLFGTEETINVELTK